MSVVPKPQFIAMKMAKVAPTTDNAPLMPHAHDTICGALELNSRRPAGIGTPSATPIGTSVATAMRMRTVRENGIADAMSGVTMAMTTMASAAMATSMIAV